MSGKLPDSRQRIATPTFFAKKRFGIVVSDWNSNITFSLLDAATAVLKKNGVPAKNIVVKNTPGSFELPLAAQWLVESGDFDAIICLGCVIKGETEHFTFICEAVSAGLKDLSLKYSKPFIFGVLTTNNLSQAQDRSGGIIGNKGEEAALTALRMVELHAELSHPTQPPQMGRRKEKGGGLPSPVGEGSGMRVEV